MATNNPHLLKRNSLFAMFCLSYLPLFLLLTLKIIDANKMFLHYGGANAPAILLFAKRFGFIVLLISLSVFAVIGTRLTLDNIKTKKGNAFPVKICSIKPKNEDALSYLGTYVIPLLMKGTIGWFEYASFTVLFFIYYKLYSTSSLILINPILNLKYGLYEIEYVSVGQEQLKESKKAMIISQQKWLNEDDELSIVKLSHRLYFSF